MGTSTSENLPPGEHPLTVPHGNWFKHGEKDNEFLSERTGMEEK